MQASVAGEIRSCYTFRDFQRIGVPLSQSCRLLDTPSLCDIIAPNNHVTPQDIF